MASLRDWSWISHAGRLNDDAIELQRARLNTPAEFLEDGDQVLPDGAAYAAVHHLDDLLVGLHPRVLREQRVVDANVAELVLDDGDLLAMGGLCRGATGIAYAQRSVR